MNKYFLDLLHIEMKTWEEKKIVSSDVIEKINAYYQEQEAEEAKKIKKAAAVEELKKKELIKKLPVIFSIIAACLIAGGIISLIAFNWHLISRNVKTCAAFVLAMVPGILFFLANNSGRKINASFKETVSLIWALLSGGMIEFICQIYKLPPQPEQVLIFWLFITIFILYATESTGTFFFSIVLLIASTVTAQNYAHSDAVFFYPAAAALFIYSRRNKVFSYIMAGTALLLLGFVLEKCVPGLWLPAYTCALSILVFCGKEKNDWIYYYAGVAGLTVMSFIMCNDYFWNGIGWKFYRNDASHNQFAAVFDYVYCTLLFAVNIAYAIKNIMKERKISLYCSALLVPLGTMIFYIICSVDAECHNHAREFVLLIYAVYTILGTLFIRNALFYILPVSVICLGGFCNIQSGIIYAIISLFFLCAVYSFRKIRFGENFDNFFKIAVPVVTAVIFICSGLNVDDFYLLETGGIITASIFICGIIFSAMAFCKSRKINIPVMLELVPSIILCNFVMLSGIFTIHYEATVKNTIVLLTFIYSYIFWLKYGKKQMVAFLIMGMMFFMYVDSDVEIMTMILMTVCFGVNHAQLSDSKTKKKGSMNFFYGVFMIAAISLASCDFLMPSVSLFTKPFTEMIWFPVFFICSIVVPLALFIKAKRIPQIGINALSCIFVILFICQMNESLFDIMKNRWFSVMLEGIFFFMIFIFALQEIVISFKTESPKRMNFFAIYFLAVILFRFFFQPVSLITRGIVFIICGIIVMILNMIFQKVMRKRDAGGLK